MFIIAGRLFYKCAKPEGSRCEFFLWASDNAESRNNTISVDTNRTSARDRNNSARDANRFSRAGTSNDDWGNTSTFVGDIMCQCNQPARK